MRRHEAASAALAFLVRRLHGVQRRLEPGVGAGGDEGVQHLHRRRRGERQVDEQGVELQLVAIVGGGGRGRARSSLRQLGFGQDEFDCGDPDGVGAAPHGHVRGEAGRGRRGRLDHDGEAHGPRQHGTGRVARHHQQGAYGKSREEKSHKQPPRNQGRVLYPSGLWRVAARRVLKRSRLALEGARPGIVCAGSRGGGSVRYRGAFTKRSYHAR